MVADWEKQKSAEPSPTHAARSSTNDLDANQQAAAERWAARQKDSLEPGRSVPRTPAPTPKSPDLELKRDRDYDRGGPEDDL